MEHSTIRGVLVGTAMCALSNCATFEPKATPPPERRPTWFESLPDPKPNVDKKIFRVPRDPDALTPV
ncbi:MAG: hypothetical protein RLZZ283_247 [Candidatus Parcubacteria bacterium]|jgi:hypothetical protein